MDIRSRKQDGVHTINQQRMCPEAGALSKLLAGHQIMHSVAELFSQNHFIVLRPHASAVRAMLLLAVMTLSLGQGAAAAARSPKNERNKLPCRQNIWE